MHKVTIYHNPRCSKSRQALALLQESTCDVEVVRYLETGFSQKKLQSLLKKLDKKASHIVRRGEAIYKELGLSAQSAEKDIFAAMLKHPILVERPIVEVADKAVLGRPPESIRELLA